jgi:broad specificity phosphatase PhoE
MNLAYIRHLESKANIRSGFCYEDEDHRIQFPLNSDDDIPLTQNGIEHGERIHKVLSQSSIFNMDDVKILCSPYLRTKQTRRILFPNIDDSQVTFDPRLCERNAGYCTSMTKKEISDSFPWLERYWKTTNPLITKPPGGESILEVVYRIFPVLNEIKNMTDTTSTVIMVGHGNLFKAVDFVLQGLTTEEFPTIPLAPNGSLTIYRDIHLDRNDVSIDKYHHVLSE